MLAIGVIGVVICVASVMLLGLDITHFIQTGTWHLTQVLDLMRVHTPNLWAQTVNFLNYSGSTVPVDIVETLAKLPATLVGLLIGGGLVFIGFRMKDH